MLGREASLSLVPAPRQAGVQPAMTAYSAEGEGERPPLAALRTPSSRARSLRTLGEPLSPMPRPFRSWLARVPASQGGPGGLCLGLFTQGWDRRWQKPSSSEQSRRKAVICHLLAGFKFLANSSWSLHFGVTLLSKICVFRPLSPPQVPLVVNILCVYVCVLAQCSGKSMVNKRDHAAR